MCVYIYISECHCTAVVNTTLQINYTSIKKIKNTKLHICVLLIVHKIILQLSFSVYQGLKSPGVRAFAVFHPGRKNAVGVPYRRELWPRSIRGWSQSQYKQQTTAAAQLGLEPKKTSHTNSHHGGRRGEKCSKKQTQERRRQAETFKAHWLAPTWVCERQSPEKEKLPLTCQERSPNLLTWLENTGKGQELWIYERDTWL